MQENNITTPRLLPHYFTKIAFGILLVSIVGGFTTMIFTDWDTTAKEVMYAGCILSFLIFALTSDKFEDEYSMHLRLKTYACCFAIPFVYIIIDPIINLIAEGEFLASVSAHDIVMQMIIMYFIVRYTLNRQD